jgi:hypothetical protein
MVKGVKVSKFIGHDSQQVTCVAWSPSGKEIASCGYDTRICLWDHALVVSNNVAKNGQLAEPPERERSRPTTSSKRF